ncbi:MAG TPA: hypothetical protein VKU02_14585 [Gemmataceae bacterium]|nr:hypothetical protein [Gemmataceae bacterium]
MRTTTLIKEKRSDRFSCAIFLLPVVLFAAMATRAADLESRVLTHYVPQDFLEKVVRTEGWTELPLAVKGGVRKDDVVRIWAGGSIDRGNGDQPGENVNSPAGQPIVPSSLAPKLALAPQAEDAFAVLFKTETQTKKCREPGKPLEITLTKDKEQIWVGFNDLRGRYQDNHLGKGRRHELDPLWVRIEVVRTIVD